MATSNDGAAELEDYGDDCSSSLYFGEDDCMDTDYDGMIYDDNDHLEAHFDNMELPPGVEAPIPWFRSSPKNDTKGPSKGPSTSTHSGMQLISPSLNLSESLWSLKCRQLIMNENVH